MFVEPGQDCVGTFPLVKFIAAMILELILCRTRLLMMPISDFVGQICLHVDLLLKSDLWSFSVIKAFFGDRALILYTEHLVFKLSDSFYRWWRCGRVSKRFLSRRFLYWFSKVVGLPSYASLEGFCLFDEVFQVTRRLCDRYILILVYKINRFHIDFESA